jgi:heme exporter protein A
VGERQISFPAALRLEARGLAVRRGFRLLFEGLDVDLAAGDILQLTGANGTGKSTLMRLLAGFTQPDAGSVRWLGLGAEDDAATLLHYHGHREGLREALTPAENLAFAAGLLGGEAARIPLALERLGVGALADLPVQVLSAGQRRRVALARLLVAPRPVWLLDEPLAALDVAGQALVSALLDEHRQAGGMAIVATHQPLGIEVRNLELGRAA